MQCFNSTQMIYLANERAEIRVLELLRKNKLGKFVRLLDDKSVALIVPLDNRGVGRLVNHLQWCGGVVGRMQAGVSG